MRKFAISLVFMTVSFLAVSCSNFALPERVHVKAEINPNIPLNSESVNLGLQIQNELDKLFTDDTDDVTVINYAPTEDLNSPQQFLISFPMKDQSLDFQDYLANDGINESLESINQKFKLDAPEAEDTKLSIYMGDTIKQILSGISSAPVSTNLSVNQVTIPLTGFTSLSFHSGYLDITFSIPAGQSYTVTLNNLRVNNRISSTVPSYTLRPTPTPTERTVTASFPLDGQTLTNSLTLSYSSSPYMYNEVQVATKIREDSIIDRAVGVSFAPINNAPISGTPIDLKMSSELVQAKIGVGSVALTASTLRNISLSFNNAKLTQEPNTGAPSSYSGMNLQTGLNADLFMGVPTNLQGQLLNPNTAKVSGSYSMSVDNPATSEIAFNRNGELEIPIDFSLESFNNVYVNSQTIVDNFNNGSGSHVEKSLDDLGKTVTALTYDEAGLEFNFGKVIEGLDLTVGSPTFFTGSGSKTQPIEEDTTKTFTEKYIPERPLNPKGAKIEFTLNISSRAGSNSILPLGDVKAGEDVTILECTPEFVFHWTTATLQGGDNTVMEGDFPADGGSSFSLGNDNNLTSILTDLKFSEIKGYLFFIGPDLGATNIRLDLTSYLDSEKGAIELSKDEKIEVIQTELVWPENKEPYTNDIAAIPRSMADPMDFTETFNRMLPTANSDGESLSMNYKMDFGAGGFTITNDDSLEVKVFRTILVLVVPLELEAKDKDAHLDLSDQLEGMMNTNLLSFTEQDEGDSFQMDVDPLTLNIGLSGAPLEEGSKIIIKTDRPLPVEIPMNNNQEISIAIADYLDNNGKFVPREIELFIPQGKSLKITQGLSVVKFGLNVGLDVTFDL